MTLGRPVTPIFLALAALLALVACSRGVTNLGPSVTDSDLLYGDEFDAESSSRWLLEGDERGSTTVQDGQLVIDVNQDSALQYTTLLGPSFDNFDLVVEAQLLEGASDATYGLLFRMSGPEQFYRFELTGGGHYVVERRDAGGGWQRLVNGWQKSAAIMTGPGAVNRLRVTADGPALAFYANDELLQKVQDSSYALGSLALDAGTFGGQRTIVAFDNLAIHAP